MTLPYALCASLAAAHLLDELARRELGCRPLRPYRVVAPGRVLFDPGRRRAELAALPAERRRALAGSSEGRAPDEPGSSLAAVRRGEVAVACRWLGLLLMGGVARHLAGDAGGGARALATLRAWAAADAPRAGNPLGAPRARRDDLPDLRLALLPVIVAGAVLRDHPALAGADRGVIAAWLTRFLVCAEVGCGCFWVPPAGGLGYHRFVDDAVVMALGCLTGDHDRFRRGVQRYLIALRQMRPDGGWPLELACGRFALWSHCRAVACLVLIAGLAAQQGYDLYGHEIDGRSVHRAIAHLLDGIAGAGPDHDLGFLTRRADGRHPMAWIEPYLARFPDGPLSRRLAGLRGGALLAERPLLDELGGGNATCLFLPVT